MSNNALYSSGRTHFVLGNIKWRPKYGDTIKCIMVDGSYKPNFKMHLGLNDIQESARIGNDNGTTKDSATKLKLTIPVNGVCDADNITFENVVEGKHIKGLIIFKDAPDELDTILIAYIGVDFTTNGTKIIIDWDDGPDKIFRI
jgi:hypothetical protein